MQIFEGKLVAEKIYSDLKEQIKLAQGRNIRLDIFLVGNDFGSRTYVEMKQKRAQELGLEVVVHNFPDDALESEVVDEIVEANLNNDISGIMVQLPLPTGPNGFNKSSVLNTIAPQKDVDGLTEKSYENLIKNVKFVLDEEKKFFEIENRENFESSVVGNTSYIPATALAVMEILSHYKIGLKGKKAVVIGASKIVGLPVAVLMTLQGACVKLCDEFTIGTKDIASEADIIVSATGVINLVKADWVKDGAVVVDVGYSKDSVTGKTCGDVDFEAVSQKASYINKAVNGVGPVTIASLLKNLVSAGIRKMV